MKIMNIQEKYFREMVQIKAWEYYLNQYSEESYKWERLLNIITAIVSSASIAGWAIWKNYSFLWGIAIAISQVITAIKPVMPYSKRIEVTRKMLPYIIGLFNRMEKKWFDVAKGNLTEEEINELIFDFKDEYAKIEQECINSPLLLKSERIQTKADKMTDEYFINHYC